jgi:adenylate cyclase
MNQPPRILVVDDDEDNRIAISDRLNFHGYRVLTASDGGEALQLSFEQPPDLILLDIVMPGIDGLEVCRRLRATPALPFIPIIMVTARTASRDLVAGLEAGGDEYLTKPVDPDALVARVRSMLRIKKLHDDLEALNRTLEQRVRQQVDELERIGRLKRFLPPQVAEAIVTSGDEQLLESHRREISVVFCDLRGYTSFSRNQAPERVIGVLQQFHEELGTLISRFEGTLERFAGDGLMVFFNDPLPCPDPAERAVRMAVQMRERMAERAEEWRERFGARLGFAIGIDYDYATLGRIGFEGRFDYAAIGPVTNRAARLCAVADDHQILVSQPVRAAVRELVETEHVGDLDLKGFDEPVSAFNVLRLN